MLTPAMTPIFDGHNDTLLKLHLDHRGDERAFWSGMAGHLDAPKARQGGLVGGLCAIFVPNHRRRTVPSKALAVRDDGFEIRMAQPITHEHARQQTLKMMAILQRLAAHPDQQLTIVRDVAGLDEAMAAGRFAAVLHFEGAEAIDPEHELLPLYVEAGLRSLGLVWSRPNAFGHGVPFKHPCSPDLGPGLTPQGRRLVRACEALGVVVDMAHLNARGFWDVASLTGKPLVVSHACAHAICPSARNLTDDQLDAIGASGGLVGVNFFVGDVRPDGALRADTPLQALVHHMAYIADRIGVDHVAFGSDFDGALMPEALKDASGLPLLLDAMRAAGFHEDELVRIAHRNWRRVLAQTWLA